MNISLGMSKGITMGKSGLPGAKKSKYNISGLVYDADGTTPVSNATVALGAYSAISAADGTYTISNIPARTSGSMTCTKSGYSWPSITVPSMKGNLTSQNYTNRWWAALGISDSCVAAYQARNAATQADSYINQKNPGTLDIIVGNAPSWAIDSGWGFNGVDDYLRTGVVPVKQLWTMVIRFTGLTQDSQKALAGVNNAATAFRIETTSSPGFLYTSGGSLSIVRTAPAGSIAIAGNKGYWNGAAEVGTIGDAGTNLGTRDIWIGCRNVDGSPDRFCVVTIEAVAIYNATLTQAQIDAVGDAPLAFWLGEESPLLDEYTQAVLYLDPIAYYPMHESTASTAVDVTSNGHHGTYQAGATAGQEGQHGTSVLFETTVNYGLTLPNSLLNTINPKEFSVAAWIKVDTSSTEIKVYEGWNGDGDYFAYEIRSANNGIFLKEPTQQVIGEDVLGTTPNDTWIHVVMFNSESEGKCGIYQDGVLREATKTVSGIEAPLAQSGTGLMGNVDGYAQHIVFFDHKLTQAEVDTICT